MISERVTKYEKFPWKEESIFFFPRPLYYNEMTDNCCACNTCDAVWTDTSWLHKAYATITFTIHKSKETLPVRICHTFLFPPQLPWKVWRVSSVPCSRALPAGCTWLKFSWRHQLVLNATYKEFGNVLHIFINSSTILYFIGVISSCTIWYFWLLSLQ